MSLEELRSKPEGVSVHLQTKYRKYQENCNDTPRGFNTPSRKIEIYSETLLEAGYSPFPDYEVPLVGHVSQPELSSKFPLILTCAKDSLFCESQHRGLPGLRQRAPEPEVDLHPDTAASHNIQAGDWIAVQTPEGQIRARARMDNSLDPRVICGSHGWWQACEQIGAPGYSAFGPDSANFNLLIGHSKLDPVSGSVPMRAYVCRVCRL